MFNISRFLKIKTKRVIVVINLITKRKYKYQKILNTNETLFAIIYVGIYYLFIITTLHYTLILSV